MPRFPRLPAVTIEIVVTIVIFVAAVYFYEPASHDEELIYGLTVALFGLIAVREIVANGEQEEIRKELRTIRERLGDLARFDSSLQRLNGTLLELNNRDAVTQRIGHAAIAKAVEGLHVPEGHLEFLGREVSVHAYHEFWMMLAQSSYGRPRRAMMTHSSHLDIFSSDDLMIYEEQSTFRQAGNGLFRVFVDRGSGSDVAEYLRVMQRMEPNVSCAYLKWTDAQLPVEYLDSDLCLVSEECLLFFWQLRSDASIATGTFTPDVPSYDRMLNRWQNLLKALEVVDYDWAKEHRDELTRYRDGFLSAHRDRRV